MALFGKKKEETKAETTCCCGNSQSASEVTSTCCGEKVDDIDMEQNQYSKLIKDIPEPDIAISMGCDVGCPFIGRPFDDDWKLSDPTGKSDEEFEKVIDEIKEKILLMKQKIIVNKV